MLDILIISTNLRLNKALHAVVTMEGGEPCIIRDFQEAIETIQNQYHPLIFLEAGIGELDPATAVAVIRESCGQQRPRIVALLEDPLTSKRDLASAGFDDVLRIPLDIADIALLIESAQRSAQPQEPEPAETGSGDATLLRQLSLDLAWSTTIEQQAQHGLEAACKLLGTERGAIWVRDASELTLRCTAQSGMSSEYTSVGAATLSFLSQEDWVQLSRHPVFKTKPGSESGATADLIRKENLTNTLTAALFTPSHVIGALVLFDLLASGDELDDDALHLVDTITAITAMALDQTRLREDLSNSEATYRQLIEEMPHGVFIHDVQGNFLMSNAAIESICGYSEDDLALMNLYDLLHNGPDGDDGKLLADVLTELTRQQHEEGELAEMFGPVTLHLATTDGRQVEAELYFRPLRLKGREDELWIQAMARDITNEARAVRELEALRGVAESLAGINDEFRALREVLCRINGTIDFVHASVWKLSPDRREMMCAAQAGVEREDLLVDPDSWPSERFLGSAATLHITALAANHDAEPVHPSVAEIAAIPIHIDGLYMGMLEIQVGAERKLATGDIDFLESVAAQIAGRLERLELIQHIQILDAQDSTTGLDNRRTFYERLNTDCERANGQPVSLLHIDVDGFKLPNDTYGHIVGDDLLRQVGETIRAHLSPPYHLARYGGDEFCVILPGTGRDEVSAVAENIRIGVATQLFRAEDQLEHLNVSIGAATLPDDVDRPDKLVAAACDASLMAKQSGRNQVYQSNSAFGELSMQHDELIASLKQTPQHTLSLLVRAMDERLPERSGHAARVARLAMTLGDHLGLGGRDLELLGVAGYIHDVGMFLVPDELLRKPVELSQTEREKLAIVPAIAHRLLSQVSLPAPVSLAVVHQYEHWDGSGYPGRLSGMSIPIAARIIAVADAVDAMTSPRAHRDPMPLADVLDNLRAGSGTRFDPDVVAAAEMVFDEAHPDIKDVKTAFLRDSLIELGMMTESRQVAATGDLDSD